MTLLSTPCLDSWFWKDVLRLHLKNNVYNKQTDQPLAFADQIARFNWGKYEITPTKKLYERRMLLLTHIMPYKPLVFIQCFRIRLLIFQCNLEYLAVNTSLLYEYTMTLNMADLMIIFRTRQSGIHTYVIDLL